MSCENCNGFGYVSLGEVEKMGVKSDVPGSECMPCMECDATCELCGGSGFSGDTFMATNNADDFCSACWSWEKCGTCLGMGEVEDGAYDPKAGGVVGGMFECTECGGIGYVVSSWDGDGDAPSLESMRGFGHSVFSMDM